MRRIRVEDLESVNCKVQLFNKHLYNLREGRAFRVVPDYFDKQDGSEVELFETEIAKIFPQIKIIWSGNTIVAKWNGTEIRACPKQRVFQFDNGRKKVLHRATKQYERFEREENNTWERRISQYCQTHLPIHQAK